MKNTSIAQSVTIFSSEATLLRSQDYGGWEDLRRHLLQTDVQHMLKNA